MLFISSDVPRGVSSLTRSCAFCIGEIAKVDDCHSQKFYSSGQTHFSLRLTFSNRFSMNLLTVPITRSAAFDVRTKIFASIRPSGRTLVHDCSSSLSSSSNTTLINNGLSGLPCAEPCRSRPHQTIFHDPRSQHHTRQTQNAFVRYL